MGSAPPLSPTGGDNDVAAGGLLHPVALSAVAVLVINDHFAKAHWPGLVTGKLSDVAGLIFFPLALQAAWELAHAALGLAWRPSVRVLLGSVLLTAVVFALVKTWGPANDCYRVLFGVARWPLDAALALLRGAPTPHLSPVVLVADASDLLALPFAASALLVRHSARSLRARLG